MNRLIADLKVCKESEFQMCRGREFRRVGAVAVKVRCSGVWSQQIRDSG